MHSLAHPQEHLCHMLIMMLTNVLGAGGTIAVVKTESGRRLLEFQS